MHLMDILNPRLTALKGLIQEYDLEAQFVCVIEAIDGDDPAVILGKKSVAFLADLGAELSFDLYYYPPDDDEE